MGTSIYTFEHFGVKMPLESDSQAYS